MHFTYLVEVDAERSEGKFASRDDIGEQIRDEIESADPGEIEGENGGTYTINTWEVTEQEEPKAAKGKRS